MKIDKEQTTDKVTVTMDEDEWCMICNSLNIYHDLNESVKERMGKNLWSDREQEIYDPMIEVFYDPGF